MTSVCLKAYPDTNTLHRSFAAAALFVTKQVNVMQIRTGYSMVETYGEGRRPIMLALRITEGGGRDNSTPSSSQNVDCVEILWSARAIFQVFT
jgi:hypothetical protein